MGDSQQGEAVVVCPLCDKAWSRDHTNCPDDGAYLHDETVLDRRPIKVTMPRPFGRRDSASPVVAEAGLELDSVIVIPPRRNKELAPGTKAGEYEIEAKIGEGAMGAVYRAVHPAIGKRVAIKVMSAKLFDEPDAVKRFTAEARAVAAIRHPGIVDVFGFGRLPDGRTYLTMEWLEGESLAARIAAGAVPRDEALDILRQIARALEAAHGKNIVHRDLKPENVFLVQLEDERVVKLLDFGLAKVLDQDVAVGVTREGQILGTPIYMSPEQCRSKGVDHRTDVYALGCLAYQLLTGKLPFEHDNAAELISAHLVTPPPRPRSRQPDLPKVLDELLVQMIAKEPDQRPSLPEVRRAIKTILSRESRPMPAADSGPIKMAAADIGDAPTMMAAAPPPAEPAPPPAEPAKPAAAVTAPVAVPARTPKWLPVAAIAATIVAIVAVILAIMH